MAAELNNTNTPVQGSTSPTGDNFAITAGEPDLCAVVDVGYNSAASMSITAITLGGVNILPFSCGVASHSPTGHEYVESFSVPNPPTGASVNLVITMAGTITDIYRNVTVYKKVNQSFPVRPGTYFNHTTDRAFDGSSHFSLDVSSDALDLSHTAINGGGNGITGTNQTSEGISNAGGYSFASDHATTPGASVTHTWTAIGGSANLAIVGFSINGSPTAPPAQKPNIAPQLRAA